MGTPERVPLHADQARAQLMDLYDHDPLGFSEDVAVSVLEHGSELNHSASLWRFALTCFKEHPRAGFSFFGTILDAVDHPCLYSCRDGITEALCILSKVRQDVSAPKEIEAQAFEVLARLYIGWAVEAKAQSKNRRKRLQIALSYAYAFKSHPQRSEDWASDIERLKEDAHAALYGIVTKDLEKEALALEGWGRS